MKKDSKIFITLAGILTTIVCCCLVYFTQEDIDNTNVPGVDATLCSTQVSSEQMSIAFILGEDKETDNPYYSEATRYYSTNAHDKADVVVTSCRSLWEVKEHLKTNRPNGGNAWGTIHLVSHGNQWSGLSVKVTPDSKRATTKRILEHTQSAAFELLDYTTIDCDTKIVLHGCGVGNDSDLVDAVHLFFSFKDGKPRVFAPKLFEYYTCAESRGSTQSERYLAHSWLVSYPMDKKPAIAALTNELREKYSDAAVDWQGALTREQPRWIGDTFHYTFEVPVKWVIPVDSFALGGEAEQLMWLRSQNEILDDLKRLQLPIDMFKWSFSAGYVETDPGKKSPAVFVKGYCTMLCVVEAIVDHQDALHKPFNPALIDCRFYYGGETRLAGL